MAAVGQKARIRTGLVTSFGCHCFGVETIPASKLSEEDHAIAAHELLQLTFAQRLYVALARSMRLSPPRCKNSERLSGDRGNMAFLCQVTALRRVNRVDAPEMELPSVPLPVKNSWCRPVIG